MTESEEERADFLLIDVCKSLKIPREVAVWLTAVELKTDQQREQMAVWLYHNKETDVQKLLAEAKKVAALYPSKARAPAGRQGTKTPTKTNTAKKQGS